MTWSRFLDLPGPGDRSRTCSALPPLHGSSSPRRPSAVRGGTRSDQAEDIVLTYRPSRWSDASCPWWSRWVWFCRRRGLDRSESVAALSHRVNYSGEGQPFEYQAGAAVKPSARSPLDFQVSMIRRALLPLKGSESETFKPTRTRLIFRRLVPNVTVGDVFQESTANFEFSPPMSALSMPLSTRHS